MKIEVACKICGKKFDNSEYEVFMDYEDDQAVVINVGRCEHHLDAGSVIKVKESKCFRSRGDGTFEFICDHREFYGE